ncbi:helix-turn-helix domain-containing protein [Serratia fonticola]|uniref:helix-turn-helix domain-containing protein n=1 Tax=Serratia fonticola TaxID=47917 RepID=UPI000E0FB5FE|nr:helix-turn-helix domain-containing protein [Serratia fonticola]RDL14112.1 winged helix-turn-helix DNA binding protein [Serratia fonticola]
MYNFSKILQQSMSTPFIDIILNSIKSIIKIRQGRPSQRFYLDQTDKKMCFLLYSGTCIAKRTNDSLVLSTINSPSVFGLHDVFHEKSDIHLLAVNDVEYGMVAVDDFLTYADEHHLWKEISYMLMLSATRFSEYQRETVGVSNYELICNLLVSLSLESFEIRATTTALEYIQERSILSRSGIMKTLSSLKEGGYIVIKKGLLISINSLPKKF